MKKLVFLLVMALVACNQEKNANANFDWQGHRGARGQVPENTIPSLRRALQDGVKTLEIDVVITADSTVVLSHEPFLNPVICTDIDGSPLSDTVEPHNIFQMTYQELSQYDCGKKGHPDFPGQEKFSAAKPSLSEAILASEEMALLMDRDRPHYNIEIKSRPEWEGEFHPEVATYVELVVEQIKKAKITDRCIIQSFDKRALQYAHENYPALTLALLVESESKNFAEHVQELGFLPDVYSCHHQLVTKRLVQQLQLQGVKVIPWTVNEISRAEELMQMGVDGIITDYPGRLIPALGSST